ncbi:hypothetical protein NEMIN01_0502 [Nematocida minor]|uniref:uncharacterized protein n=1 Tax=Nematocida minor TaxID=1912983 RepID=UPI00221E5EDE|nr:uncharacterized protein NEMIN01_0502 [Nematocida minor]KAI5189439.1 hypothetical protein NEMIN01_0502 [Nematocida minor]
MSKSLEEETKEEYVLELLCSEGDSRKINFIGDVCTIGTVSKVDVKLKHPDLLEFSLDYKNDLLRVVSGKVKINGEIITKEFKIHYPCIIDAADQLLRITKVAKDPKTAETQQEAQLKAVKQFITSQTVEQDIEDETPSDHTSDASGDTFSNEIKNQILSLGTPSERQEAWDCLNTSGMDIGGLPDLLDEDKKMISELCERMGLDADSNETDKELEPEMYSDEIRREQEEQEAAVNEQIVESVTEEKQHPANTEVADNDASFNVSRISIFEGIPYMPSEPEKEEDKEERVSAQSEANTLPEESTATNQVNNSEIVEESEINNQSILSTVAADNEMAVNEAANESVVTEILADSKDETANADGNTVTEEAVDENGDEAANELVDDNEVETTDIKQNEMKISHGKVEEEVPTQEIKPSEPAEETVEHPSTPKKATISLDVPSTPAPSTPGRSLRRASISQQIINQQKTQPEKKKKKKAGESKRKKQKTKK